MSNKQQTPLTRDQLRLVEKTIKATLQTVADDEARKPRPRGPTGRRVGRPSSPDGDVTLHMRTTVPERAEWQKEADSVKMKLTTWVKLIVNTHIKQLRAATKGKKP